MRVTTIALDLIKTILHFLVLTYLALVAYKLGEYNTRLERLNYLLETYPNANPQELVEYMINHNVLLTEKKAIMPIPDDIIPPENLSMVNNNG